MGYAIAASDRPDWQVLGLVFVLSMDLGVALESLQLTIPYRQFNAGDLVMNGVGTVSAVAVRRVLLRRGRFDRVDPVAAAR